MTCEPMKSGTLPVPLFMGRRFGYDQLALFDLPAMVDFGETTVGAACSQVS